MIMKCVKSHTFNFGAFHLLESCMIYSCPSPCNYNYNYMGVGLPIIFYYAPFGLTTPRFRMQITIL